MHILLSLKSLKWGTKKLVISGLISQWIVHQSITSFAVIFQSIFGQTLPPVSSHVPASIRIDPIINISQIKIEPIKNYAVSVFKVPEPVAAVPVAQSPPATPIVQSPTANIAQSGCGDNFYANYIYMHESGCRTDAIGPNGPCGLGQALPCSKLTCSLSDYACQNAWFTNYAMQRYGSWVAAYDYWITHHNW